MQGFVWHIKSVWSGQGSVFFYEHKSYVLFLCVTFTMGVEILKC